MKIGPHGLALIKSFESFVPYVYDDKVAPVRGKYREWQGGAVKGTLTIGYGHTNAAKHPLKCTLGTRVTETEALKILDVDLDECESAVNSMVKKGLNQGEFDALTSFTFNCGAGNLKKLIAPLNRGDYAGTRAKFDEFIRSKGEVMNGLVRRRNAEQALWDENYDDIAAPTAPVFHPAEVDEPSPTPATTKETVTTAGGGTLGVLEAASQTAGTIKDIKSNVQDAGVLDMVQQILINPRFLIACVVVVAALSYWFKWPRFFYEPRS